MYKVSIYYKIRKRSRLFYTVCPSLSEALRTADALFLHASELGHKVLYLHINCNYDCQD